MTKNEFSKIQMNNWVSYRGKQTGVTDNTRLTNVTWHPILHYFLCSLDLVYIVPVSDSRKEKSQMEQKKKFSFSEKAIKKWRNLPFNSDIKIKRKIASHFCGLLRIYGLYFFVPPKYFDLPPSLLCQPLRGQFFISLYWYFLAQSGMFSLCHCFFFHHVTTQCNLLYMYSFDPYLPYYFIYSY